jgi:hypothetical protein
VQVYLLDIRERALQILQGRIDLGDRLVIVGALGQIIKKIRIRIDDDGSAVNIVQVVDEIGFSLENKPGVLVDGLLLNGFPRVDKRNHQG